MTNRFLLPRRALAAALAGSAALLLAACGDSPADPAAGPDTPPAAAEQVPATALASPDAYTRFAAGLSPSETGRPLTFDPAASAPPTSETAAPQPI